MTKIIETPRFYLREFNLTDAPDLKKLNDADDVFFLTGDPPFASISEAERFVRNYNHYKKYGFGRWSIIDKGKNQFVGWCGLKYSPDIDEVDIGFRIDTQFRGKGIATETGTAVLNYGFDELNFRRIIARCVIENEASRRVIEKLGMLFFENREFESRTWLIFEKLNV